MAYKVDEVLYMGAETRVLLATHVESGTQVVLKVLLDETANDRSLQKLQEEYRLLRELEVPGVIRAIGFEPYGQWHALVVERWGDKSLDRLLAQGPIPVGVALRLGARIAHALGEIHQRGVLHRDIKPQTVASE